MKTLGSFVQTESNINGHNWLESRRTIILGLGYRLIELKSNFKRWIRDSYRLAEESENYQNITLSAVEGQQGTKSF